MRHQRVFRASAAGVVLGALLICPVAVLSQKAEYDPTSPTTAPASDEPPKPVAQVRAQVEKINRAWAAKTGNAALLGEVLSDTAFAYATGRPDKPGEALVLNKQGFCATIETFLAGDSRPVRHAHRIESVAVFGPLAYEVGISEDVRADGAARRTPVMNLFALEGGAWRMVCSVRADHAREALGATMADEKRVRELVGAFVGVFRSKDATPLAKVADFLAEDFVQVMSRGGLVKGKQANLALYGQGVNEIKTLFTNFAAGYDIQSIRMTGQTAIVFGKLTLAGQPKRGGQAYQRNIWETLIFQRVGAKWLLIQEQSTLAKDQPPRL